MDSNPQQLLSSGAELHRAGKLAEAAANYQRVLQADPRNPDAWHLLGVATLQLGNPSLAADYLRKAISISPSAPEFHRSLGRTLLVRNDVTAAVATLRKSVELDPRSPGGWNMLASALLRSGQAEEAVWAASECLRLAPNEPHFWADFATSLWDRGDRAEAIEAYQRALELDPQNGAARENLAQALRWTGQFAESIRQFRLLLSVQPKQLSAWTGLGYVQHESGDDRGAIETFGKAIALSPNSADAHMGLAHALLKTGQFPHGWAEYEWRWGTEPLRSVRPRLSQPMWDGHVLNGERVLLHAEQGFGDTIQFVRFARDVAQRGGRAVLVTPPELTRLCASAEGLETCISRNDPIPQCEYHCPLMSLAHVLGKSATDLPGQIPYLAPPPELIESWRARTQTGRFNLLIVPAGNTTHVHDRRRSVPGELFESLSCPNISVFQVQPGALKGIGSIDVSPQIEDFMDTAALIKCMNLTICVWREHWAAPCGCFFQKCPTGDGCATAPPLSGTRRCESSGRVP
jgi:Flp pilus assembly protein TadD